jgi:hypothetical protein
MHWLTGALTRRSWPAHLAPWAAVAWLVWSSLPAIAGIEYTERGAILTLTRADVDFVAGSSEGELMCTICGILACNDHFWLVERGTLGLREFDKAGHLTRVVPYPQYSRLSGSILSLLAMPEGLYALSAWRPDWPGRRLSLRFYDLATESWSDPIHVPDAFQVAGNALGLTEKDGEVWACDTRRICIPLSAEGLPLSAIDSASVVQDAALYPHDAVNPVGLRMMLTGAKGHRAFYAVANDEGSLIATLERDYGGDTRKCSTPREYPTGPFWAVLADSTILELRSCVRGQSDDKVQVIAWTR